MERIQSKNQVDWKPGLFRSFLMGGFEACYAMDEHRRRLDLLQLTCHEEYCREDFRRLKENGIFTVRESMAWHQIDQGGGRYDFSRFERIMAVAQEEDMQIIWSLNHFDFPLDIDPFSEELISRFAAYAGEAVKTIRKYDQGRIFLIPINEISFVSWMCGDVGVWWPYAVKRGMELKKQLVRAILAAMQAVRELDEEVHFIHIDPIMRRLAAPGAGKAVQRYVNDFKKIVFQSWDMISGRLHPELGGRPEYLEIIGLNYYVENQDMVYSLRKPLGTQDGFIDCRRLDFDSKQRSGFDLLIGEVYERYGRPLLISETGSYGSLRMKWWKRVLHEIDLARQKGIPILGVCAYPVVDRPDWHQLDKLTNSGFWDFAPDDPGCARIPQEDLLEFIRQYQPAQALI